MKMLLAALATLAITTPALAEDDTPTPAQRASAMKAVGAAGCSNPTKIERDDGGYEAENARCKDGLYDLKLSADFNIVSREKDDND